MVLQTLRSIFLIALLFGSVFCSEMDNMDTNGISTMCITTTELDFTEKEACHFDNMTKEFVKINGNNLKIQTGSTSVVQQEETKYGKTGVSSYKFLSGLDQAKALMMMQNIQSIEKIQNYLLIETQIKKMNSQMEQIGIENQINLNDLKLKQGM